MNNRADELETAYRRTATIGGAMMSTLLLYAVVAFAIASTNDPFEGLASLKDGWLLRNLFLGLSLLIVVTIQRLRSRTFRSSDPSGLLPTNAPGIRSQPLSRLVANSIVTFALAESIAIYGLVLFLLNGESTDFFIFLGLSLLTFILFFPRYHQWEEWMQRQQPIT